ASCYQHPFASHYAFYTLHVYLKTSNHGHYYIMNLHERTSIAIRTLRKIGVNFFWRASRGGFLCGFCGFSG
ncbi:MAG: hypothetical protein KKI06_06395, partial [Euryarchaeota archaeon]|nr:hypothetical protein [Euryarchaeota archaeon]